ncbi:MAG TPA: DUF2283 domain-containing protein [Leptospiraceae bacterium]|nr:DUF2283 domain-containing protein [Leptospiraceae bacterium]HRG77673.1 DUF2283 domain-containing protein [Leptospiraceae bacterium]
MESNKQYVICVDDTDYPVSLTKYKIYEAIPYKKTEEHGMLRIIDNSEEDYFHGAKRFIQVESFDYDKEADVMYVSFVKPQNAVKTLPQDDGSLWRYNEEGILVGITFMNYQKIINIV